MRRAIAAVVGTIGGLIMLLSFKSHPLTTAVATGPAQVDDPSPTTATTAPASSNSGSTTATTAPPATTSSGTKTVTGSTVQTRYGPVVVQVTVTNGRITAADAIEYPTARSRDIQINSRAVPALDREVLAAQSANIDMVSGATYTSRGYIQSLQSALDKVGQA